MLAALVFVGVLIGQWIWTSNRLEQASQQVQQQVASLTAGDLDKKLRDALSKAHDSVYLVLTQNSQSGTFQPQGTAWVVDQQQGILATAGHVAELFDRAKKGQMIARSRGAVHGDFVIKDVEIHPGYKIASRLRRQGQLPSADSRAQSSQPTTSPIAFCDVALLYVDNTAGLAAKLPLANSQTLGALKAPDLIGFIGYLIDNNAGFNPDSPESDLDSGSIAQLTDYFDAATAPPEQQLLIHHRIATAGGASGSPILDPQGNVVAVQSAGNYIFELGARIPTGDRYAQRADLVSELLAGEADSAQAMRTDQWIVKLDHYADVAQLLQLLAAWKQGISAKLKASHVAGPADATAKPSETQLAVTEPLNFTAKLSEAQLDDLQRPTGVYQSTLSFTVHGTGELLVTAYTASGARLGMTVYPVKDFARQPALPASRDGNDRHPFARADVAGTRSFDVVLSGDKDADPSLSAYLATVTPQERRDVLVSDWFGGSKWIASLPQSKDEVLQYRVLKDFTGQTVAVGDSFIGTTAIRDFRSGGWRDKPPPDCEYFAVANAKNGEDISLEIYSKSGDKLTLKNGDQSPKVSPNCAFQANDGDNIVVNVAGPRAGIDFQVVIYSVSQTPAPR